MASLMKDLMDKFYQEERQALKRGAWEASEVYALAESYANLCHQLPPAALREKLSCLFQSQSAQATQPGEQAAWAHVMAILEAATTPPA